MSKEFCCMKLLENRHLKDRGDGRLTVRCILRRYVVKMGGGWNWLRILSNGGLWY
jgi:hypothetical protein